MIIPDHYIFTADERANRNVDICRDFSNEQNIKYFYDIKDLGNFKVHLLAFLDMNCYDILLKGFVFFFFFGLFRIFVNGK